MSKKSKSAIVVDNSQKTKKAIIIAVICVVVAIVIAVSLVIALWQTPDKTVADLDNETAGTSSLTIKNGNFEYVNEDATLFPKTAQSWNRYTYKPKSGTSQGYTTIGTNEKTVMGIVDTSEEGWTSVQSDLAKQGIESGAVANPGKPDADSADDNVYMIYNKTDTTSSIYSQSFSVASASSVKVTMYLNAVDVTDEGAFVMLKYNSSSALEKSTSGTQNWYAYRFGITETKNEAGENGWQKFEFYIFNQTAGSKTVYCNIGLGNVYNGDTAQGKLFIDEITYETVTANDYRLQYDNINNPDDTTCYVIEKDVTDNTVAASEFNKSDATPAGNYNKTLNTESYIGSDYSKIDGTSYSPFVVYQSEEIQNDPMKAPQNIVELKNDATVRKEVSAVSAEIQVNAPLTGIQLHISLWVRVITDGNKLPVANLYLMDADGETLSSFTSVAAVDDIAKDTNNGWMQYHFYVKPSQENTFVKLLVTLGNKGGYEANATADAVPNGTVLVTEPLVEQLTQSEYAAASSGTYVKKVELGSSSSSSSVTNDSFSSIATNSPNNGNGLYNPSGWTPVFANQNDIYLDGRDYTDGEYTDPVTVPQKPGSVISGVMLASSNAPTPDDKAQAVLQITNVDDTSFGYLSSNITLAAKSVTVISVLAMGDGAAVPYVYLLENAEEDAINLSFTKIAAAKAEDSVFNMFDPNGNGQGWTRYYFVIATGDNARTVRLALFNGAIDASVKEGVSTGTQTGTVYFDQITQTVIGTYTRDEEGSKEADDMTYTATAGYEELDKLELDGFDNVSLLDLRLIDVNPVPEDDDGDDDTTTTPTESNVDAGLLVSIISSALLVGALLIVVVVKAFKKKQY